MSRESRASQFAPFDALKGLNEALKLVEYEHEKVKKEEISEEKANKITNIFINFNKQDEFRVKYFCDGHIKEFVGKIKLDLINKTISFNKQVIFLEDLIDIDTIKNNYFV